jgi:hypothetical protein
MKRFMMGIATHYLDRYLSWLLYLYEESISDLIWINGGATRPPVSLI